MKVAEMIAALQQMPLDAVVVLKNDPTELDVDEIEGVDLITVERRKNGYLYTLGRGGAAEACKESWHDALEPVVLISG